METEDKVEQINLQLEKEMAVAPTAQLLEFANGLGISDLDGTRKTKMMSKIRDHVEKTTDEKSGEEQCVYMENVFRALRNCMKQDDSDTSEVIASDRMQGHSEGNHFNFSAGKEDEQYQQQEFARRQSNGYFPQREMPRSANQGIEEANGTQQVLNLIQTLADTNVSNRRQLKILGVIGDTKDPKSITFINVTSQVTDAKASGYKDDEIARSIKKAVAANSHLRTYFDSVGTMPLLKMLSILRDFYQEKSAAELFSELGQLVQNPTEKSTDFLLRAMQSRQRTTSAATAEGNLFDAKLVQGTFIRTLKTGFKEESIRSQMAPFLDQNKPSDDSVLLREASLADLEFEEKMKKQKRDKKVTISQASVNSNSPDLEAALKPIVETMSNLQRQMGEMQQTRSRDERRQGPPQSMYKQRGTSANDRDIRDHQNDGSFSNQNGPSNHFRARTQTSDNNFGSRNQDQGSNFRSRTQSSDNTFGSRNYTSDNGMRYRNNSTEGRGQGRANSYSRYSNKPDYRCNQCRMDDTPRCNHCWKCGSIQHRAAECTNSKN